MNPSDLLGATLEHCEGDATKYLRIYEAKIGKVWLVGNGAKQVLYADHEVPPEIRQRLKELSSKRVALQAKNKEMKVVAH